MNILFLTHYYTPEVGAAIKRIAGLAKQLSAMGNRVEILTGFPNYPLGIKPLAYQKKLFQTDQIEGLTVHRYYVYASQKQGIGYRLLNYLSLMFSSLLFLCKPSKFDVIIVSSPPLFLGISGCIISRVKRIPMMLDIRDIWPDIASEMKILPWNSFPYKLLGRLAQFLYQKADGIMVVTRGKVKAMLEKGIPSYKLSLVPNGFDEEFLDGHMHEPLVRQYDLASTHNLVYTGLVGLAQGLDLLVETAHLMRHEERIRFYIVGEGPERAYLESKAKAYGLNNIIFTGVLAADKILTFLKHAEATVIPLKNNALKDSIPSKMLESMGAGCPVILCAGGEAAEFLMEAGGGIVIEPNNKEALRDAIKKIIANPSERQTLSRKGQEFILKHYTRKQIAKSLYDCLYRLQGGKDVERH